MTRTLALDPALSCGWAFGDGGLADSGVWCLKSSSQEHAGAPLVRLEKRIIEAVERFGIRRLVFEASAYGGDYPAVKQFHNGARGVMLATAFKLDLQWAEYVPSTIKAFAGSGRYKKPQMIESLKRHYGIEVRSDDEADAIWILLLDQHRRSNPLAMAASKPKVKKGRRKAKDPTLF
jgi:Holliday junction resolvasome RuvABC endonuclease subunit